MSCYKKKKIYSKDESNVKYFYNFLCRIKFFPQQRKILFQTFQFRSIFDNSSVSHNADCWI